jgi:hypothetical protein
MIIGVMENENKVPDWPEGWVDSFAGIDDFERPPQGETDERELLDVNM